MAKMGDISQIELINAIENTTTVWRKITKDTLYKGNFSCPLCTLIKNTYKITFQKGSARGACMLCPVKHMNAFHICVGIAHVFNDAETTNKEIESLREIVLSTLDNVHSYISNTLYYNTYVIYAEEEKQKMLSNTPPPIVRKNKKQPPPKQRRIFKTNRSR